MNRIDRSGEIIVLKNGLSARILKYYSARNITVIYNDGTIVENIKYINFKLGKIKNNNHKNICSIGYFGYGDYNYNLKTKRCYDIWSKMIKRCYSLELSNNKNSYKDVIVCEEWHNFQNFAKWYDINYIDGFELDKDILKKGNKIYSPYNCCFVPQELNKILTLNNINRGKFLLGVTKKGSKFISQINIDGIPKEIGRFDSEIDAFDSYKYHKENMLKLKANKYKKTISNECYKALMSRKIEIND